MSLQQTDTVWVDPPAALIAERKRLGLDGRDEIWDGSYHMAPHAADEHQRMEMRLLVALVPVCDALGLELRGSSNLFIPGSVGWHDVRVPDLVVFPPASQGELGVVGPASLVVEIRSPGDESYAKVPFYDRSGAGEVVVIDRDTKAVRRWARSASGALAEGSAAVHRLACLPVALSTAAGQLVVDAAGTVTRI